MRRTQLLLPIFLLVVIPVAVVAGVMMSMNLFPVLHVYFLIAYAVAGLLTTVYSLVWLWWNPDVDVRNYWLLNIGAFVFYGLAYTAGLYKGGQMVAPDLGFLFAGCMMVLWLPVTYLFWFRKRHNLAVKRGWN